jgi:ParB/RepB/Spo0J family partition protein
MKSRLNTVPLLAAATLLVQSGDDLSNVPSSMRTVLVVDIRENKTALREVDRKSEEYQQLLASVKKEGVIQSITVRECIDPENQQKYYGLVDGLHRLTAARDAGITSLDCKVIQANDFDVLRKQIILNIQRVETKPAEYSQQLARMLNANPALTMNELAEMIHKSPAFIYERLSLLKLNEKIAKLVDGGEIPLANAYSLAKLPAEEQGNFVDRAITMQPPEFIPLVSTRVKEIREAKRKGQDVAPAGFVPVARLRKLADIKDEFAKKQVGATLVQSCATKEDAFAMGVAWCLHMDPVSQEQDKAKEEARKVEAEAAKKRRAAEKEKEKQAKALATGLGVKE